MDKSNAVRKVVDAVADAVAEVKDRARPDVPGAPGAEPPPVAEPTEPRAPLSPKPDRDEPVVVSATGRDSGAARDVRSQSGGYLTRRKVRGSSTVTTR